MIDRRLYWGQAWKRLALTIVIIFTHLRSNFYWRYLLWTIIALLFFNDLKADTLKVGIDFNYPPFTFLNENGKASGRDVELLNALTELTGHEVTYVYGQWNEVLKKLENREIDIIAGIVYSEERDKVFDFSIPVQTVYYSIFTHKDTRIKNLEDLRNNKGVTLQGDIVNDKLLKPMGLLQQVSVANSLPKALMLIEAGKYDYTLAPYPLGMNIINEKKCKNIRVKGPPILPSVHCLAVHEGNHKLLATLNHGITEFRTSGMLDKIDAKWVKYKREENKYRSILIYLLIALVIILVFAVLAIIWSSSLKKQVKRKTYQIDLAKRNYSNIFNSANDGMIIYDKQGIIVDANIKAKEMYGYINGEMIGLHGKELISQGYHHVFDDFLEKTNVGKEFYTVSVDKTKDGKLINTDLKGTTVSYKDKDHFLIITRDISTYIKAKKELENARHMAESANQLKSAFFSNISHEIRTPLNAILGYTYILKQSRISALQKDYLNKLSRSSNTLLNIIEDILDISKIESGKFELDIANFQLSNILKNVSDIVGLKASEKNINFEFEVSEVVPDHLIGDDLRLQQILLNLCNNAVKFTEKGKVKTTISVQEKSGNKIKLLFTVADTGIGIKQENLKRIFNSFEQVRGNGEMISSGGTGLGLTICKHLVMLMRGDLWVNSTYGRGTVFYFTAEFLKNTDNNQLVKHNEHKGDKSSGNDTDFKELKVLLVDDNDFNLQVTKNLLELKQMDVTIAKTAESALHLLSTGFKVHVILMDVQLPGICGYEATKKIRELPQHEHTPVIALSAYNLIREKEKYLACGMIDYISKPIDPEKLFHVIAQYVLFDYGADKQFEPNNNGQVTSVKNDEILNSDKILQYINGNKKLYLNFLRKYLDEYKDVPLKLKDALKTEKTDGLKTIIHNLKNAFGTIGAFQLMDEILIIEHYISENNRSAFEDALPHLIEKIIQLNETVEQRIATYSVH